MTAPHDAPSPRHRLRLAIVAAVVVSVAAIAATYLLFFTDDSPPPLQLSAQVTTTVAGAAGSATTTAGDASGSPSTTATGTPAGAGGGLSGQWRIGNNTTAGYRVREKLARLPAQSDAVGRTSAVTGSIQVGRNGSQLLVADGARFEVDVTRLTSDESQRDNRIRTQGLESNRFPTATFVSTAPMEFPSSAESGVAVKTSVTGDLTIHGVTKRVTIPLDAQVTGGRIEVVGSLTFPFSDFGMTPPNIAGFVTVENNATLEFQLFFDKA